MNQPENGTVPAALNDSVNQWNSEAVTRQVSDCVTLQSAKQRESVTLPAAPSDPVHERTGEKAKHQTSEFDETQHRNRVSIQHS